jgi:hypothetical protein
MGTAADGLANRLKPIRLEVGVIAALRDGRVSLASTRLDEMTDHVIVDSNHTGLPYSREVYAHVRSFLRAGRFLWAGDLEERQAGEPPSAATASGRAAAVAGRPAP